MVARPGLLGTILRARRAPVVPFAQIFVACPRPVRILQESAAIRCNYPETYQYLKAKRNLHPRDDAIEDYTQWTLLGESVNPPANRIARPGEPAPPPPPAPPKKEETEDDYVNRRCEEYMHKSLSSRRGLGGKFFTIGGGGDGGVSYQVI